MNSLFSYIGFHISTTGYDFNLKPSCIYTYELIQVIFKYACILMAAANEPNYTKTRTVTHK
jgi:hypothetical protein